MTIAPCTVRRAETGDVPAVHAMIHALASFERLSHRCIVTEADIFAALFGPHPAAEALIAWVNDHPAGFALFFHSFSTFRGCRNVWLEDLFVQPEYRRQGCAAALLQTLAALAVERNCARFEWTVLDWNVDAIDFYQALGAAVLPDWRIVRVEGEALAQLAGGPPAAPAR